MSDPAGTAGAVQYYVNSSTFGGDKDKLFLDTSNVRLGIGTDSPVGTVHLSSDYGSTETGWSLNPDKTRALLLRDASIKVWAGDSS